MNILVQITYKLKNILRHAKRLLGGDRVCESLDECLLRAPMLMALLPGLWKYWKVEEPLRGGAW
jgi:hypothetical protein